MCGKVLSKLKPYFQDTLNYKGRPDRGSKSSPDNCSKWPICCNSMSHHPAWAVGSYSSGHQPGWRWIAANAIAANMRVLTPCLYCIFAIFQHFIPAMSWIGTCSSAPRGVAIPQPPEPMSSQNLYEMQPTPFAVYSPEIILTLFQLVKQALLLHHIINVCYSTHRVRISLVVPRSTKFWTPTDISSKPS